MLLGDARTMDERGLDIEKTEHRVLDGERIRDERTANRRGARFEAYGRGQIRKSEKRPLLLVEEDKSENPRNVPYYSWKRTNPKIRETSPITRCR